MLWEILGSLGGVVAFLTAVIMIVRAVFKQIRATEDNTGALNRLNETVMKLDGKLDDHEYRITRLETINESRKR